MAEPNGQIVDISRPVSEKELAVKMREFYDVLFRHKLKIVIFLGAVLLTTFYLMLTADSIYKSDAQVLVKRGRESMTLDPTATMGRVVAMHQTWDNILNSELAILTSREIARKTVESVGADVVLEGFRAEEEEAGVVAESAGRIKSMIANSIRAVARFPLQLLGWADPELSDVDRAIEEVYYGVDFTLLRKSSIISMTYQRGNAELAQHILAAFIDSYIEKRIEVYRTPGSMHFFQEQRKALEQEIKQIDQELAPLRSQLAMTSLKEQRALVLGRINRLLDSIDRTETSRAAAEARVKAIERLQPDLREASPAISPTATRLPTGREEYNEVKLEYIQHTAGLAAHEAEVGTYKTQLATAYEELGSLEDVDLMEADQRIQELERERRLLDARYQAYFDSIEQTRIGEALENEKISNISIVQPATLAISTTNASKIAQVILALIIGLGGGVALAFIYERMDATLRTPESVESRIQLATLASVPVLGRKDLHLAALSGSERSRVAARDIYESLRDRLLLASGNALNPPVVIGVTSCRRGEGVSTTASNLAVALARDGDYDVLLVDTCFTSPGLHKLYGVDVAPGLVELIQEGSAPVHKVEEHLHVVCAGRADSDLPKSFLPERYDLLAEHLQSGGYHMVILDMPPIGEGSSTARLAGQIDGVVLVAESENVRWQVVANAKRLLRESRARILGVVLNKRRFYVPDWLYKRL